MMCILKIRLKDKLEKITNNFVLKTAVKRIPMRIIAAVLFVLGVSTRVIADAEFQVQKYSVEDGLSHPHTFQTFQDSRGFLWVAAANGLNFFDGRKFHLRLRWPLGKPWQTRIVCEDSRGYLWVRIIDNSGQLAYKIANIHTGRVSTPQEVYRGSLPRDIIHVAAGPEGSLLISDRQGNIWRRFNDGRTSKIWQSDIGPVDFCFDRYDGHTLWLLDHEPGRTNHHKLLAVDLQGRKSVQRSFQTLEVWHAGRTDTLVYYEGLNQFRLSPNGDARRVPLERMDKDDPITFLHTNISYDPKESIIWMIYYGKLRVYDTGGKLIKQLPEGVMNGGVSLYSDEEGNAWVSSFAGIWRISSSKRRFNRLLWLPPESSSNPFEQACRGAALLPDGRVALASGKGIWFYDPRRGQTTHRQSTLSYYPMVRDSYKPGLWLGTAELNYYDVNSGVNRVYFHPDTIFSSQLWSIFPMRDKVLLGYETELMWFDRRSAQIVPCRCDEGFPALRRSEIHQILPVRPDSSLLWLVTSTGIYEFEPNQGLTRRYWSGGTGIEKLPVDNIRHVIEADLPGTYWMASLEGLIYWNRSSGEYRQYKGFLNNNLYAVYDDGLGFLWMSSDLGIIQMEKSSGLFRHFTVDDGISNNEFNRISHLKTPDGTIYFGSLNGFTVFRPVDFSRDFHQRRELPVVMLSARFMVYGDEGDRDLLEEYHLAGEMALPYSQGVLSLSMATPRHKNPKQLKYQYRLSEKSSAWIDIPEGNLALSGIPFGQHTLELRVQDGTGSVSSRVLRVPIRVPYPIYLRWWFVSLVTFGVFALTALLFSLRIERLNKQRKLLEIEVARRTEIIQKDKELIEAQAKQIMRQNEEKSRFFSNVTHEFRTPLTLITGPLSELEGKKLLTVKDRKHIAIARRNAMQLARLVNDLLFLSKLDVEKPVIRLEAVDIQSFISDIVQEYDWWKEEKQLDVVVSLPEDQDNVFELDRHLVARILRNLLSNAFKFSEIGGYVFVGISEGTETLTVTVQDTGRGIDPEDMPHIFERYFQTHRDDAVAEGGTGIGLSLVSELTNLMGGQVSVTSQPGMGAVFTLTLPAARLEKPDKPGLRLSADRYPTVGAVRHPSLLLVEDHADLRNYIGGLLLSRYKVIEASHGREALAHLQSGQPIDLLVTDIMMPGMDGYQLMRQVRNNPLWAKIPILVLSARADQVDQEKAFQFGVDDYLIKPFDKEELMVRLEQLLVRRAVRSVLSKGDIDTAENRQWLLQLEGLVHDRLPETGLTAETLAAAMFMGRSSFFEKVKMLTGLTPTQYIQEVRLLRALYLVEHEPVNSLKALARDVGYKDEKNFSALFRQRFGKSPVSYYQDI
jgi:signal transduction histidine kinase/DNA-binding NarL/FixJ family response regulator/ligand-binding sensor domain-containing protein